MNFTELLGSIVFEYPEHLSDVAFWHGHVPFAFWCVEVVQPGIFVELGTHKGDSYCAFCQAVHKLGLPTACYAVDTWQGDQHVGVYGEEVYETLQRYHDKRYGAFSRLVRSTFDEAIEYFADGSIDLLHIDGLHTYEAVQHDFETWLPKLSGRAVVLLHDINVRQRDSGTWRFWEELCERYPHFSFLHSHGLGVLAVGQKPAPAIKRLCNSSYEEIEEVRSIFARLGHTIAVTSERDALAGQAARLESILTERDQALAHLQTTLHKHETALAQRNDDVTVQRFALEDQARLIAAYEAEHRTFGAQVGRWLSRQRNAWAPPTSPQGKILGRMIRAARVLYEQGVMPLVRRAIYSGLHRVRPQRWPAMDWLHTSGLFDAVYYLSTYPDVGALRMDPAKHYIRFGWKEGRNPHALFDTAFYLEHNPDVAQAGVNPLWHYVTCGWQEGRNPHTLFDTAFYLEHNPDVAQAGVNPLWHYVTCGWQEGRNPHTLFDTAFYLEHNPDVAQAGVNPLWHYATCGWQERRAPQAPFDTAFSLEGEYEPEVFPGLGETSVKLIAFYLPQFHPIPENDRWWGKGFTEWTNVSKARPLFPGHYQPHLPGELGFYDLRLLEVMQRQIELAKQYGLYGFCFYLYWFHGKRLLERPVEQFLAHPELDFPFCLCWANENWTRRWDGYDQEILIAQDYSLDDDLAFIRDVEPYLRDPRYIRVNGKPLLLVYNPGMLPDAQATVSRWRAYCRSAGIGDLCVAMAQTFGRTDPRPFGFDAAVEFPPLTPHIAARLRNVTPSIKFSEPDFVGAVYNYADVVRDYALEPMEYALFKGVMPGWDNTARRDKRATIFANSSPQAFQTWLETAIQWTVQHHAPTQRLVFINAWNEWAEGTHLEPDRKYGYAYLNATARALQQAITKTHVPKKHTMLFLSHDAVRAGAQVLVLDLLGWIKDRTAIQPKILLGAGGALEHAFREIADVLILDDLLAQTQSRTDIEARLKEFCGPDIKLIYASTVVSGKYLEYLAFLKAPVVAHVHELQKSIEKFAGQQTMDKLLRYTQHYIVGSPAVCENFRTTYRIEPEKMEVVYDFSGKKAFYPSDQEKVAMRATLRLDPRKTLIFGCGFCQWRKGPDLFVAVAEQFVKMGRRDFHCYWIGERDTGEYADLDGHILERGLREHVTFLGGKDNLREYFIAGDIFLLPSREDTFPLVCLEAAACGLPIICFADAGGMPDFVEQDAGFVVAYENIAQMADKLALLITDETLRQTLGNRAREKFLARHTLDRTAPAVLKSMQKVAGIAPAMSVIVPVYNHAPFLRQRLESIFQQTFQDLEVILLDDGSTDGSITILQEYASRPNVRLEVNTHNRGAFAQWLKGLDLAAAELIWIAEDDDFCDPDFLETLVPFFDDPDTRLAYCNSHAVDAEGNVTRDLYLHHYYHNLPVHKWRQDYINTGTMEVNQGLAMKNTIPNVSAVVFRKPGDLATIMPEILTLRCAGDWLLYLHLLKQGKIGYSARGLNYHRRHPDSVVSRNAMTAERTIPDYYRVHQYVLQHYDIAPDVFEGMVRFMEQELRRLFPELSDEAFSKLYDSQALRRLYTPGFATP